MSVTRWLALSMMLLALSLSADRVASAQPGESLLRQGPVYPLKASGNNRYLVDQSGNPVMLVGDSPHSLFVNLTTAQADSYFANRASYGINVLWIEVLCNDYTGGRPDGSTYDGIVPFTTPGDMSTPNEAYFARVDSMIQLAASRGITVLLDAFETAGWMSVLQQNGPSKAFAYGAYLGNRYRNVKNIIWITGNDFQTWDTSSTDNASVAAIMQGIAATDPNHLQTTQLNYPVSGSLDDPLLVPYTGLAGAYTYYPTYAKVLDQYNANRVPVFMEEANYEFEQNHDDPGIPATLRRQEYWTMLSGATGQLYGNHYTWTFTSGWQNNLDTPGVKQLQLMKRLFSTRAWWQLVPDQTHAIVTAGYGTFADSGSLLANDYVTAASVPDGSLVMAYCPVATTLTVDMTKLRGLARARWYDPSNGTFTGGSLVPNNGSRTFTTPGRNGDGDFDWVLVLESPR